MVLNRPVAIFVALALLLSGGVVHGLYSDRWRSTRELEEAIERVPTVPRNVAGWQAEDVEVDPAEYAQAGAQAYWVRSYRKEGQEIFAILMAGRAGRMAIHTPEVCYRGAGFELVGRPAVRTLRRPSGAEVGSFWTAPFEKANEQLVLYWAWNDGRGWQAPSNPRWEFAGRPALYKLYFSRQAAATGPASAQAMEDFLKDFVPALNATLENQTTP